MPVAEIIENQAAQRGEKRRSAAERKGKGGKRAHSAKAAMSDEMARASEDKPMRRNDLRS